MSTQLTKLTNLLGQLITKVDAVLPSCAAEIDWQLVLAAKWQRLNWCSQLVPLTIQQSVSKEDLLGLTNQWQMLRQNTAQLVNDLPANHALLWGSRGTGKSTMVRALLSEFAARKLRLIELPCQYLADLPQLINLLAGNKHYFIIFCDDLSFTDGASDFRHFKTILDGSLEQAPDNVLIYATSNRRHLVVEKPQDNANWHNVDGELHPNEAVEEKISLSDRFGLWLAFYPFSQTQYLQVAEHWLNKYAQQANLAVEFDALLQRQALQWALQRGNRSGRCAAQFARQHIGLRLLAQTTQD